MNGNCCQYDVNIFKQRLLLQYFVDFFIIMDMEQHDTPQRDKGFFQRFQEIIYRKKDEDLPGGQFGLKRF
jgi:hypothetical protein